MKALLLFFLVFSFNSFADDLPSEILCRGTDNQLQEFELKISIWLRKATLSYDGEVFSEMNITEIYPETNEIIMTEESPRGLNAGVAMTNGEGTPISRNWTSVWGKIFIPNGSGPAKELGSIRECKTL